jgi:hypothetical protein
LANTSALNFRGIQENKFEIPPTTTSKAVKEKEDDFTPNIYPDTDKILSKRDQCVVIRQFKLIEGQELLDCHSSFIPLKSKYIDADNVSHILLVYLSDSNILEVKQIKTSICRKIRRYFTNII